MHSGLLHVYLCFSANFIDYVTVEQILAYGYIGKSGKMHVYSLSFKAGVSIQCIIKLSMRIDYPTPDTLC